VCVCVRVCVRACGVCACVSVRVCVCVGVCVHIYMHTHSVLDIVWCCGLEQFSSTNYYEQTHSVLHIVWCCGLVRGALEVQAQAAAADLDQIPLNDVLAKCRKLQASCRQTLKTNRKKNGKMSHFAGRRNYMLGFKWSIMRVGSLVYSIANVKIALQML
jgi:hypothetical protein